MALPKLPILQNGLTLPERVVLANLTRHNGFPVLIKIVEAGCEDTTQDVMKADPEDVNYDQIVKARASRSRYTHEFAGRVRDSINYHVAVASNAGHDVKPDEDDNPIDGE